MGLFAEITSPDQVDEWLSGTLSRGEKVMGFGHRVYKHGDSRMPTMRASLQRVANRTEKGRQLMAVYDRLETAMKDTKGLYPNLDYATGPAYYLMGFDIPTFTPIFVMSRVTGLDRSHHRAKGPQCSDKAAVCLHRPAVAPCPGEAAAMREPH